MTTITQPANFGGKTPKIDPANAATLLIDCDGGADDAAAGPANVKCRHKLISEDCP